MGGSAGNGGVWGDACSIRELRGCSGSSGWGCSWGCLLSVDGWLVHPVWGELPTSLTPPSPSPGPLQEPQDLPGGAGQDEAPPHPLHSAHPQRCGGGTFWGGPAAPHGASPHFLVSLRSDLPARRQQNPPGWAGQRGEAGGCYAQRGHSGDPGVLGGPQKHPKGEWGGGCRVLGELTGLLCVPALHRREGEDHPQVPEPPAV